MKVDLSLIQDIFTKDLIYFTGPFDYKLSLER